VRHREKIIYIVNLNFAHQEKTYNCWNQQELIASPNHSILSHGCKEEDEQGFDGDERRGADSSYILAYLFTGLGAYKWRSIGAT
jgi:hypothetical protein